ncbi:MAG: winged helix-turn-helix domain-containing protein [Chthoniobacterales bacterium]
MQGKGKQPQADPVLERALSHPRRTEIFSYLMQKRGSGTDREELVEALGLPAPRVRYHLLVLREADLIVHSNDREQGYIAAASACL